MQLGEISLAFGEIHLPIGEILFSISTNTNQEYFFGWVDRELAVVAPNVL